MFYSFTMYNIQYSDVYIFIMKYVSNAIVEMDQSIISIKPIHQITHILMTFYYQLEL
jgi:hypothetical protein